MLPHQMRHLVYTLSMKNTAATATKRQPKREIVLTCRVDGAEVSLEELALELVRCGGIAAKGRA
jgi:hypothetical protein